MNKNQEIVKTLQEYELQEDEKAKIDYIRQKNLENWSRISEFFPNITQNMMLVFLYEYFNGIYKVTNGKVDVENTFFKLIESGYNCSSQLKTPINLSEVNLLELRYIVYSRLTSLITSSKIDSDGSNILNNTITEGINDFISNWVIIANGFETTNTLFGDGTAFGLQQEIIKRVFSKRGTQKSLTDYIKSPEKIISYFESVNVNGSNFWNYAQEFVGRTQKIDSAITNNLSSKANDTMIKRAYTMLWRENLEDGQKRLIKYFLAQEIDTCYVGNEDSTKKVTKNEMLNAIDASEEFGMIMNKTFPKLETKEEINWKNTNVES